MYNVVCLKWGTKFQPYYVNRLFYGVRRNSTVPFIFHCFTDNGEGLDPGIECHPLPHANVTGWWQKLYLFSDDLPIKGRILFLDLDTLIVKNIDHYITHDTGFWVLRDLWVPKSSRRMGSAVMNFEIGSRPHVWNEFLKNPEANVKKTLPHGDQRWIQNQDLKNDRKFWQDKYPGEIVSFKSECRRGVPKNAKIICYHGTPSIEESITKTTKAQRFVIPPTPWVKEYWKDE